MTSRLVQRALLLLLGLSFFSPGVALSSPSDTAGSAVDTGWDLVIQYGPFWGGALLVLGAVGAFLRRNAATHWLAQGRALAAITAVSMVGGAVLNWHLNGADFAGVVVTAIMALKLVWSPTLTSGVSSVAPASDDARALAQFHADADASGLDVYAPDPPRQSFCSTSGGGCELHPTGCPAS